MGGDILKIGLCGYFPEERRVDVIETMNALLYEFVSLKETFEDLARLIEECGYLLYNPPTPPREYARSRSKSQRDLYRHYERGTDAYIYVAPKNLPYMRRPH